MGFWSVARRLLVGEPAFKDSDIDTREVDEQEVIDGRDDDNQDENINEVDTSKEPAVEETPPLIEIVSVNCHIDGDHMDVYGHILNHSREEVELDKVVLLDQKKELDNFLYGGESREYLLYSGPLWDSQTVRNSDVVYKTKEGNYWRAEHYVRLRYLSDTDKFIVDEIKLLPPVRNL